MCSKSKRLRWADLERPDLNQNENCSAALPRPLASEIACSPSLSRISSTRSQGVNQMPSRVPLQLPGLNCKKSSRSDCNDADSNKNQGYTGPSRLPVKKKETSPGPVRVLASQTSKIRSRPPVRVQVQSPSSNQKQDLYADDTGLDGIEKETPIRRPKLPSGSSTAPSRVRVQSAPSPGPRRILATPSSKSLNQTPVRVPVQKSSILRGKRVLYADSGNDIKDS